jgi:hypothetical protein
MTQMYSPTVEWSLFSAALKRLASAGEDMAGCQVGSAMQDTPLLLQLHSIAHISDQTRTLIPSALATRLMLQRPETWLSLYSNLQVRALGFRSREEEIHSCPKPFIGSSTSRFPFLHLLMLGR